MRNLIPILLAVVVLCSGCDPDGYSCNSEGCYAADDNPQYQTLEDCNSLCDEPKPGGCGSLVLHEDYLYSTVQIGNQCWFSENCRYLPSVSPYQEGSQINPYYYVYDYQGTDVIAAKATANYSTYGVLYNWPAVIELGLCPSGWHVASDEEFTQLTDFLGGESVAGGKMKEAGSDHWNSPNIGATNSSGFTGLPGGNKYSGGFGDEGNNGAWWTTSVYFYDNSWNRIVTRDGSFVFRSATSLNRGFSARCVQD
jgi:uncharacterized protein (TIGR02145 family)